MVAAARLTAGGTFYAYVPPDPTRPRFYVHLHGPYSFKSDANTAGKAIFTVADEAIRQDRMLTERGKTFNYLK